MKILTGESVSAGYAQDGRNPSSRHPHPFLFFLDSHTYLAPRLSWLKGSLTSGRLCVLQRRYTARYSCLLPQLWPVLSFMGVQNWRRHREWVNTSPASFYFISRCTLTWRLDIRIFHARVLLIFFSNHQRLFHIFFPQMPQTVPSSTGFSSPFDYSTFQFDLSLLPDDYDVTSTQDYILKPTQIKQEAHSPRPNSPITYPSPPYPGELSPNYSHDGSPGYPTSPYYVPQSPQSAQLYNPTTEPSKQPVKREKSLDLLAILHESRWVQILDFPTEKIVVGNISQLDTLL